MDNVLRNRRGCGCKAAGKRGIRRPLFAAIHHFSREECEIKREMLKLLRVCHEFNAKYTSEAKKNRQNRFSFFIQSDIMNVRWRQRTIDLLLKHSQ